MNITLHDWFFLSSFRNMSYDAAEHKKVLRENEAKMNVFFQHKCVAGYIVLMFLKLDRNTSNTVLFLLENSFQNNFINN